MLELGEAGREHHGPDALECVRVVDGAERGVDARGGIVHSVAGADTGEVRIRLARCRSGSATPALDSDAGRDVSGRRVAVLVAASASPHE